MLIPPARRDEGKLDIGANVSPGTEVTDASDGVEGGSEKSQSDADVENMTVQAKEPDKKADESSTRDELR